MTEIAKSLSLFKVFIILTSGAQLRLDLVVEHCTSVTDTAGQLPTHFVQPLQQEIAVLEVEGFVHEVQLVGLCEHRQDQDVEVPAVVGVVELGP